MKRWSIIFKTLGNINRLKITVLLTKAGRMAVSDIAKKLKISVKSASKNLVLLQQLDVLENVGRSGHVYYEINPQMPADMRKTLKLFT